MEVDGIKKMFGSSIKTTDVKYARYIRDGYSATYKGLLALDPYDVSVGKIECCYLLKKDRIMMP